MNLILTAAHKAELELMATNPALSQAERENSSFYKEIQTATSLNASRAVISDAAMVILSQIVGSSPVTEIDLIDNHACNNLLEIIKNLPSGLKRLDLMGNNLKGDAIAVAEFLSHSEISQLSLRENKLAEHGPAVTAHLKKMKYLKILDLSYNEFREHGTLTMAHLSESESNTLFSVRFNDNLLLGHTPDVAEVALEIKTLERITLYGNCEEEDIPAIENIFEVRNQEVREKKQDLEIVNSLRDIHPVDLGRQFGTTGTVVGLVGGVSGEDYDMTNLHEIKVFIS